MVLLCKVLLLIEIAYIKNIYTTLALLIFSAK